MKISQPLRGSTMSRIFHIISRSVSIALLSIVCHQNAMAQIALSTSTPYTQNFDGIGTTATATLPATFRVDKPAVVRTVGTYAAATTATSLLGGANLSSPRGQRHLQLWLRHRPRRGRTAQSDFFHPAPPRRAETSMPNLSTARAAASRPYRSPTASRSIARASTPRAFACSCSTRWMETRGPAPARTF